MEKRQFFRDAHTTAEGHPHWCGGSLSIAVEMDPDTFKHQYLHFLAYPRVWQHRDQKGHSPVTKVAICCAAGEVSGTQAWASLVGRDPVCVCVCVVKIVLSARPNGWDYQSTEL